MPNPDCRPEPARSRDALRLSVVAAAAMFVGVLAPPSAFAVQFFATTLTGSGTTQKPGPETGDFYNKATGPAYATSTSTQTETTDVGTATGYSLATASAEAGAVRSMSLGRGITTGGVGAEGAASSRAIWDDTFVFDAAGYQGQTASLNFGVVVDGLVDAIVDGAGWGGLAWWRATLTVGNQSWVFYNQLNADARGQTTLYWVNPLDFAGSLGSKSLSANVVVGEASRVRLELETTAKGTASASFGATKSTLTSDLGSTFYWAGIDSASVGGTALSGYTALTNTGTRFDLVTGYVKPAPPSVPEPATLGLMGLGLVGLCGVRRRRR